MPYQNLDHIFRYLSANARAALPLAALLDLVDDHHNQGANRIDQVTAAEVEAFVDLLGDKLLRDAPERIAPGLMQSLRYLLGRTLGDPVVGNNAHGWMYMNRPLVFANCSRTVLSLGIICRLVDSARIQQRGHQVCGPVVYLQSLARTRSLTYTQLVTSLAQNGQRLIDAHFLIRPGANVLQMPYRGSMAQVDYIALASLRSSTALWGYAHQWNINTIQGATVPSTVADWLRRSGYSDVQTRTRALHGWFQRGLWSGARQWLGGQAVERSLTDAEALRARGYVVLLIVHPSLANGLAEGHFNNNRATGVMNAFGGHWVVMEQAENISAASARITISTWGPQRPQHCQPTNVPMSKLVSWYWGFVAANPRPA